MYNYNETMLIYYILGWGLMRYPGNSATTFTTDLLDYCKSKRLPEKT